MEAQDMQPHSTKPQNIAALIEAKVPVAEVSLAKARQASEARVG